MTTWTSRIPEIVRDQLPQAYANTLNGLALGAVEDARTAAAIDLNIKSRSSVLRNFIKAPARLKATKRRLVARVVVGAPPGAPSDRGNVLTQHEEGGLKTAHAGNNSVAFPSKDILRKGQKRSVPLRTEFRKISPLTERTGLKSRRQYIGGQEPGTFLITLKKGKSAGRKMLLQRYGRGSKSVRGLWLFVPQTKLTPKLRFNKTVSAHVKANLTRAFKAAISQALATARPLKGTTQSSRI